MATIDRDRLLANHERLVEAHGDRLPQWTDDIAARAKAALKQETLPGVDNPLCGRGILDFLAAACRETGEEQYAEAAAVFYNNDLKSYKDQKTCPGTLHISFAVGNSNVAGWLGCLPFFLGSPAMSDDLIVRIVDATTELLNYLYDNIGQGNMNWRLAHADSLLLNALRLEGIVDDAIRWKKLGVDALNDAFYRQWLPDGVHIEKNPHYHMWPLCMMDSIHHLGQGMPELGIVITVDQLSRMWDYGLAASLPNGDEAALHDSQSIRIGKVHNYMREYRDAFRKRNGLPLQDPPTKQWFPDAGQAFLRDSWEEGATYITFDATRWGTDHAHLSRNSIQVHANRRTLICDPGWLSRSGSYSTKPIGLYGKSTPAHNTLNLNGWNQSRTNPSRTNYRSCDGYDIVWSDYEGGYWPGKMSYGYITPMGKGIWASHHRTMLWIHDRAIVVIDSMYREMLNTPESEEEIPSLESNWQFSEGGGELTLDQKAGRLNTNYPESNALLMFPLMPKGIEWDVQEGREDPPRGWVAGPCFQGITIPAPQLCLRMPRMADQWVELVTVIVPYAGTIAPEVMATAEATAPDNIGHIYLAWGDGKTDEIHWFYRNDLMIGNKVEGFDTDGSMVHITKDKNHKILQGAVLDGTYIRPYDQVIRDKPALFRFS